MVVGHGQMMEKAAFDQRYPSFAMPKGGRKQEKVWVW